MGMGSVAPVHTARGRPESKRLRPTLAGHAEGCPVIAVCLGHSEGPGTAPSAVTQVPAALPRSTAGGLRHGDTPPSPLGAPLFPSAPLKPLPHLCQGPSGREPGVLCPCCPQPFIGGVGSKWGEPLSHPALDGKSSGGWGEEPAPEKIQQEREAEGALAPKPAVSYERSSTHPARRRRVPCEHRPR